MGLRWRSDLREAGVLRVEAGAGAILWSTGVAFLLLHGWAAAFFAAPAPLALGVLLACGALVVCRAAPAPARLGGSGVGGGPSRFTRDDFLTPFSKTVVGPLALNDFHGGDAAREVERDVDDSTRRRFAGRSKPSAAAPSSLMGTCTLTASAGVLVVAPAGVLASMSGLLAAWAWWGVECASSAGVPVPRSIQSRLVMLPRKGKDVTGRGQPNAQTGMYRSAQSARGSVWVCC